MKKEEIYQLAELMHNKLCHYNHTDHCDWEYGRWYDIPLRSSRQHYYNKAEDILKTSDYKTAVKIISKL